ncbi:LacI family DNA-binding transcriptional regulator [uncultured Cohaesibacter sp.]|uniref:LacI family DNA-binding transcriptional regulator n=1 Tax=uncultured Cohaesibacter sp. TaxID=1002546 RepID=UPI0029C77F2E|nr:LacI family DNA-binding transcriptional regulator [uncultured Cohaesibacter sp.]
MRPTTKDLAEAAGVSLATVDRVLNHRPNVSGKSIQKVNEAIERIGFVRNFAAVSLVRNKTYRVRFILPDSGDQYLEELLKQIAETNESLQQELASVDVMQLPMSNPHAVANYLATLKNSDVDGVAIMAPESPQVRDAMARLSERDIKVVQFLSGQEKNEDLDFVGIDNYAAGATAARIIGRFLGGQSGKIMVISETMQALDSIQRRFGFDRVINQEFPNLTVLPSLETYADSERTKRIITRQIERNDDILALYVMSAEARVPIMQVASSFGLSDLTVVAHERTPFSEVALRKGDIDAIIAQNPTSAVRKAVRILRARSDNRQPNASQENLRIEVLLKDNL